MAETRIPNIGNDEASLLIDYTHGHADAVLRSHRWRTAANSAGYLRPELRPGRSLLDVGCGPGTLTTDLAHLVAPGEVLGIDPSADVIAEAQQHAANVGSAARFEVGDLESLAATTDARFDIVHAHQVLQHVHDPAATLRAMRSLTADGGVVAARDADYSAMFWWPREPALGRWLEIYRAVTRHNRAECDAGRQLLHWARQAGSTEVTFTTSTWTYASPDDVRWWADLWADRITTTRLGEQATDLGLADAGELAELAAGWRYWATHPDAVFVVPHGEIVCR